jgi:hypothetical protein
MSGATTQLGDPNLIAGIGNVSIDGVQFNISDVTWGPATWEYETLSGYNGYHGRKAKGYKAGFIAFKVRDEQTIKASDFRTYTNSEVIVNMANGKTIDGQPMCCMDAIEVDANEGDFSVRFEGPTVGESGSSAS